MNQPAERYDEQLARVRLMAEGDPTWDLSPNALAALTAVLKHYDAYAAVVAAAKELSLYDDFGGEELLPGETLEVPRNPTAMNAARRALYEALQQEALQTL
jgi:hypothetical protein